MVTSTYTSRQLQNREVRVEWISNAARHGRICIVCGAGISLKFDVPSWPKLIAALGGKSVLDAKDGNTTWEHSLEEFVAKRFSGDYMAFSKKVKTVLYKKRNPNWHKIGVHPDMEALALFCMYLRRHRQVAIISFNYDSYLEEFFLRRGLSVLPHTEPSEPYPEADVVISHPHGYLPYGNDSENGRQPVVLDQRRYMESRRRQDWWDSCSKFMTDNLCIFIGLSGRCPNLDFLAIEAQRKHSVKPGNRFWGVALTKNGDRSAIGYWERRGIFGLPVGVMYEKIPDVYSDILEGIARAG